MAVASLLTLLEDMETSPTFTSIGSGGGATANNDVFMDGIQSGGRRADTATDKGFMVDLASTDLSGAGEHVRQWLYCFHWSAVTALHARIYSGSAAYDNHDFAVADLPILSGWLPMWFDVSRTPDSTAASGANEAAIVDIGFYLSIGNVGGAGSNTILDLVSNGTSGLQWTGTGGTLADFRTYEAANFTAVLLSVLGADLLLARLEIGNSGGTQTGYSMSGVGIVAPDQALVSSTFMGITVHLQHASSDVSFTNGSFASGDPTGGTNKPDLLISGTTGAFDADTWTFNGLRTMELNQACSVTNCTILNTGVVDATNAGTTTGADLSGTTISSSTVAADAAALLWDVNADPNGELDDMTHVKGTAAHHAMAFGSNAPLTTTLTNWTTSGFNASDGQNDSTFLFADRGYDVTWTVNIIGGTGNFSYKKARAGDTVNIVFAPVTHTVKCTDAGVDIQNIRVLMYAGTGVGDLKADAAITSITRSGATVTVTTTAAHLLDSGDVVLIKDATEAGAIDTEAEYTSAHTITVTGASTFTYTVVGTPTTPATRTYDFSEVIIDHELTNASGEVSDTRSYSAAQSVRIEAVKGGYAPTYEAQTLTGTVSNTANTTIPVPMVSDD